jgi:hypothetical protein
MTTPTERSDWLEEITLVSQPDIDGAEAAPLFDSPGVAIEALAFELGVIWDGYRSGDPNERRIGNLHLGSGAYIQWIGYAERLAIECSSNTFLQPSHLLSAEEEERLVHWGFSRPTDRLPNFWLDVTERAGAEAAAFAIVAVMTTVFGIYAG